MATRIAQQNLTVGQEASSAAFTPAGESQALTCTVTELVADSVVRMLVIKDTGQVKDSLIVNGTGAKKLFVDKLDGTLTVRVEQLQGSGQVQVTDPDGGAGEASDIADNSITNAKLADAAVDTAELAAGAATLPKIDNTGLKSLVAAGRNGAGAITLTGAAVGDRLLIVMGTVTAGTGPLLDASADFETTITIVNQIQQVDVGDLTGNTYQFILIPAQA